MTPQLQEALDALSKDELIELRKRLRASMPKEQIIARMNGEEGMPQDEYDRFVYSQLELYKQERALKMQKPAECS